jgi:hypothetical protein
MSTRSVDIPKNQLNTVIHEVIHMVLDLLGLTCGGRFQDGGGDDTRAGAQEGTGEA